MQIRVVFNSNSRKLISRLHRFFSKMPFVLPSLPYDKKALEPVISSETLDYHYGKHHAGYVTKLNSLIKSTEFENETDLMKVIMKSSGPIYNNASQIWNHTFYWSCLRSPSETNMPTSKVAKLIEESFGSFELFKESFAANAAGHFGSGWIWLVIDPVNSPKLKIVQTHDGDNPEKLGLGKPVLTCDVWEHAYYIDYRNNRGSYVDKFFSIINWDFVESNLS
ncbi:superoxide dismutase [Cryptosporidium sp. chipmunk genotype I]|uniref:superoxide dismutase n=1 Tax=Cryptosporidium sp. chipmunk genotype I TaxID=1280935 RepID=UPI00351A4D09|nr:superoxide dismutase [Cryptosporidium sp. chipmunk genotype I]